MCKSNVIEFNPSGMTFFFNNTGGCCLKVNDNNIWENVALKLAFPYSDPENFVTVMKDGREVCTIEDISALCPASEKIVKEVIQKKYHIPEIREISRVEEKAHATRWTVQTDSGEREFEVQHRRDIRKVKGRGVIIVDVDGNRFRISDPSSLDKNSLDLMNMYW